MALLFFLFFFFFFSFSFSFSYLEISEFFYNGDFMPIWMAGLMDDSFEVWFRRHRMIVGFHMFYFVWCWPLRLSLATRPCSLCVVTSELFVQFGFGPFSSGESLRSNLGRDEILHWSLHDCSDPRIRGP